MSHAALQHESEADLIRRLLRPIECVMRDTRLGHGERRLAQLLWISAGARPGTVSVRVRDMAAELGADAGSVSRWLRKLDDVGRIHVYATQAGTIHVDLYDPREPASGRLVRPDPQTMLPGMGKDQPDQAPDTIPVRGVAPCVQGATPVAPYRQGATPVAPNTHISARAPARAPFVVVVDFLNNNNLTQYLVDHRAELLDLARKTYSTIHGHSRPPRISDHDRATVVRCAYLAVAHWGEDWLHRAATARPTGRAPDRPMAFFRAAAAYAAYEEVTGERAETEDERQDARKGFAVVLRCIDLPPALTERRSPE